MIGTGIRLFTRTTVQSFIEQSIKFNQKGKPVGQDVFADRTVPIGDAVYATRFLDILYGYLPRMVSLKSRPRGRTH